MIYALSALILLMLGYMFWSSTFRMRHDRLRTIRKSDRSAIILTRKQRVRMHLNRAFGLSREKPEWESGLLNHLATIEKEEASRGGLTDREVEKERLL